MLDTVLRWAIIAIMACASVNAFAGESTSGNATFLSDYLFRGVSQTANEPAVQATLEYDAKNGIYAGIFGSNVSALSFNNGDMETDLYAGWRGEVHSGWTLDAGLLHYYYADAKTNTTERSSYDTTEVYGGITWSWLNVKYSRTLGDYFGVNNDNNLGLGVDQGGSAGSDYLEVNLTFALNEAVSLIGHAGHQRVTNYSKLNYTDERIGVNWLAISADNVTLSLQYANSDADKDLYSLNDQGKTKRLATGRFVFSISKGF